MATALVGQLPAPKNGWVQNASMMEPVPYSAEVLDNWFPTAQGMRLRRGRSKHATIGAAVTQVMSYHSGSLRELFAADANNVYDVTSPADVDVAPTADITGLTGGDWSYVNFGTSAGNYLWMVNGTDAPRHYNGTTWATPTLTGTGLTNSDLSHCWVFNSRIFAVEKNTLSAWYLATDAISGTITEFPLRTVFSLGGNLLFGAAWSLDSGSGIDDVCVFVTDRGEVAVYEGTDPASASTFSLAGVYRIAEPLSKHAHFQAGGDLAICTEDGIISLSAAVQRDRSAVSRDAISYRIEDAWREAVTLRESSHNFNCTIWHSRQMLVVSVPDDRNFIDQAFVCNVRTGAWCRFTNWDVQCSVVVDDQLYFGTTAAEIWTADVTGQDGTEAYTARWLPKHMRLGGVVSLNMARVAYRGNVQLAPDMTGAVDYDVDPPPAPESASDESTSVWGTAIWGDFIWGAGAARITRSEWQAVYGTGNEVSIWLTATSGRLTSPEIEVFGMEFLYEAGRPL